MRICMAHLFDLLDLGLALASSCACRSIIFLSFQFWHLLVVIVVSLLIIIFTHTAHAAHTSCAAEFGEVDTSESAIGTAAHTAHASHAAHVVVIVGNNVLLVLVDPLAKKYVSRTIYESIRKGIVTYAVEVCLEEVHLLCVLEQTIPVLCLELLLLQNQLYCTRRVVDLARGRIDLGEEFECHGVVGLLRFAVSAEGERLWLDVELDLLWVDVRYGDGQEDVVLLCFGSA